MKLLRPQQDLPLARDASARFLPWLIAFMVFLAALALASAIVMRAIAGDWDSGLTGRLTVQVPPADAASPDAAAAQRARLDAVVDALAATPGVSDVEVLDPAEIARLLEPWLGETALLGELPLPDLVAVTLADGDAEIPPDLGTRLQAAAPGTTIDDHQRWIGRLLSLARSIELTALLVVLLVGTSAVVTVVFVTRTGLAIHRQVIELLHLMGAQDRYIARQFQRHALGLGLKGGLVGLAAAVLTLLGLGQVLRADAASLLPAISFSPFDWLLLALLPAVAGLVAMLTARWTVLRTLARLS